MCWGGGGIGGCSMRCGGTSLCVLGGLGVAESGGGG